MKTNSRRTRPQWQPLALAALLGCAAASQAQEAVTFDRPTVPAAGSQTVTLQVPVAGRYALRAASKTGVAIRVVDRMSGWSGLAGSPGESDGRLDLFLDRGTVRLVTSGAKLASGEARLAAEPFVERHAGGVLPVMPDLRLVSESLADLESASWWIEVRERRRLDVEAAGRSLADLRLWRDGAWLLADTPASAVITPEPQRPLTLLRLSADLEPGLYRLSAYGGPALPWARDSGDQPLHVRTGIPRLPAAGRTWRTVSPFGYDRFLVPGKADTLRLELPEAKPAALDVWDWDEAAPFPGVDDATQETIDKDSVPPVARFETAPQDADRLLEVHADAGQPYVLQQASLMNSPLALGGRSGAYWLSVLNTGGPADSLDPTALLVRRQGDGRSERLGTRAVPLSKTRGWARRFNLTGEVNLFIEVLEPADYEIAVSGLSAEARIEPVRLDRSDDKPARMRALPASWTLPAGLYAVTLASSDEGAIAVAIRPRGLHDPLVDWVGVSEPPPGAMPRAAAQFGVVRLAPKEATELLASQAGARLGLVLRATPIDVEAALPIAVEPGVELEVPIRASGTGRLTATADDGSRLELQVDGGEWSEAVEVAAGEHAARVRSAAPGPRIASLALVPRERLSDAPLLAAAGPEGSPPPDLGTSQETFFDIERAAHRTFLIAAPEGGLYRVESTGLLRTAGALRTRVAPSLAAAQENGTGRNFLLSTYLREGDYQLAVSTLGESAGHAGISLRRATLRDRGELVDGLPARSWVGPEEALLYRFSVGREGHFALAADGLRGAFAARLEDADGWPVDVTAEGMGDVALAAGDYRLLVFPQAVPARAVVRLDRRSEPPTREGHGPHVLPLGDSVSHVWTEPSGEGERTPDRWLFTLPAAATVDVTLDAEMTAEIASSSGGEALARVQPGRPLRTSLPAGEYVAAVRCSRRNNRVAYTLRVVPVELVAGTVKIVTAPVEVPVAIGRDGFYEIDSQGQEDVRARLVDATGHLLQASDDRPGDWNFLVARRLAAGRYSLRVDAAAGGTGVTTVSLRERLEVAAPGLAVPGRRQLTAGADQLLVPLELPARADFLAATALTSDGLGLELERDTGDGWRVVSRDEGSSARVAVALPGADRGQYRLRVRALDRRPLDVALAGWAGVVSRVDERALRSGATLRALPGLAPPLAVASVELTGPGCFEVLSAPDGLEQAIAAGEPLRAAPASLVATGRSLWLAVPSSGAAAVSARRWRLGRESTRASITLAAATPLVCDVEASSGPRWVRTSTLGGAEPLAALGSAALPAATAIAAHDALALDLGGTATAARAWVASSESPEARIEARSFPAVARESLAWGAREIDLSPGVAHRYVLPSGAKSARLSLSEGAAALWLAGDRSIGALWAARDAVEERRDTTADGLLVVPTTGGPTRARIDILPLDAAPTEPRTPDGTLLLTAGTRHEARFDQDGVERLELPPGSSGRVRVRGALRATLLGIDGSFVHGNDFDSPAAGGTLLVEHGAGLVAAWIDAPGAAAPSAWGFGEGAASSLAPPAAVTLHGQKQVEYRIETSEPRLLHVRPTNALAAGLLGPGSPHFDALAQPRPFVAFLPAGESRLLLRGLAGEALDGGAEISAEPLAPLGEGLGEIVLLPAGGARGYRFRLDTARRIGVGVQADAAGVELAVFDARGERLGQAVAQWLDLEAGDYAVALLAPNSGAPVTARPALVGLVPPGDGPPPEAVAELLARLGGAETVAGGTVFQVAPPAALLGFDEADSSGDEGARDESWNEDSTDDSDAYDESEDVEGDGE